MNPLPVTDADLNAYVDGQLAQSRMPAVEEALRARPVVGRAGGARQRATTPRCTTRSIRGWPSRFRNACLPRPTGLPKRARRTFAAMARALRAAAATLVLGLGFGWFARDVDLERAGTPTTFTRQAALTHALYAADVNRPVEVWAAEEKRPGRVAVQAPGLCRQRARSQQHRLRAGRRAAGRRATRIPRRCSCTRTPTSSGCRCRCASSRSTAARSRSATRSRMASVSSTGSRTTAATRCPAISTARSCLRSAASSTASWLRWRRRRQVERRRTTEHRAPASIRRARIRKVMFTRSATAIAPFSTENGVMPNADWSIAKLPVTENLFRRTFHCAPDSDGIA